jgi:N-acetylglucosaminyldiphosphoundecaprenol N-acetyl-beta-D-mannosaminyltransferase
MLPAVRRDYPQLQICGWEPSVFRELTDPEVEALAERIRAAQADFVWVALGAPRQEYLMHRLKGKTGAVMTGVGGAFHILSGAIGDAPAWMQNVGLEWFYRLCKEPKRLLKRYLVTNTKFILYHLRTK